MAVPSAPDVQMIRAPMGGAWALPITDEGEAALVDFFDDEAAPIAPLGGAAGYIVEPYQGGDLVEYLADIGCSWTAH